MGTAVLFAVLCLVAYSKAMECGIGKVNSEEVKKTLSTCIKNNETLERIWEMAASSATPSPVSTESDSSSVEDEPPKAQSARMSRIVKRASNTQGKTVAPPEENEKSDSSTTTSTPESGDACIVQCVFKELGMTDESGFPEHSKIVEGLVKNATGRELQIFLQEAAGECFQEMDKQSNTDPCVHSSLLVTCLANKGRMNCDDWPAGNLPF